VTINASLFTAKVQVIHDPQGRVKFWQRTATSREHFHVGVWVDGDPADLDRVRQVEYELHPSFRRRLRSSRNRENNFGITIWTWGLFNVHIVISMLDGSQTEMDYFLDYQLPADDGTNYVQVDSPT
jgi:transcription initiation factor IIF auxiliary subunit